MFDVDKRDKVWVCPSTIGPWDATDFMISNIDSPIDVIILNSTGGDVAAGLSINHIIREMCPDVKIFATAFVLSAANLIFAAARPHLRLVTDGTMFLLHPISMYTGGRFPDILAATKMGEAMSAKLTQTLRTGGYPPDLIERSLTEEVWFNSDYAIEQRLCRRLERLPNADNDDDDRRGGVKARAR